MRADMYMLREVDQWFERAGHTNRRIYVDYTGPMDTVVYQWEFESFDEYFTMERGTFIEPDKDTQSARRLPAAVPTGWLQATAST